MISSHIDKLQLESLVLLYSFYITTMYLMHSTPCVVKCSRSSTQGLLQEEYEAFHMKMCSKAAMFAKNKR